ncbi:MAG: RpiB/LacA/LacB family sugar-phosphate isomerase [Clostridia bacterium]|nr:RpiB/LacA/LacB family sugar-phosphate isomerase [Clostridia bacterium]
MKIYIGYDHRGTKLAFKVMEYLVEMGHEVNEPFESEEADDYPDIASIVCEKVAKERGSRGLLICGTGIGIAMSANRNAKIRAVLAQTEADAYFSRRHEDANVLVLAGGYTDNIMTIKTPKNYEKIIDAFLTTNFEGGRHERRVKKLELL